MTIGYHFVGNTLRDGSPVPKDGVWLHHKGSINICQTGLHYSLEPFDALQYAPGSILCQVEVNDIVETESDKGVARSRKIIQRFDATEMLRWFARDQALSVIHLWKECPPDVVLDYLMTGDESLRAAAREEVWWSAAGAAARDAAGDAAACSAAEAAREAAWDAAVAMGAAEAARRAARAAARKQFNKLVYAEFA